MPVEIDRSLIEALRDRITVRQEAMLAFTRKLVEAESPSGDSFGSQAVASLFADEARATPGVVSVERITSEGYGEHLRICAFSDDKEKARKTTLLIGHTDTVYPRGTTRERPWTEEGGRVYAPGIFDMKANCALALEALRACAESGLAPENGRVVLLLTRDEETGSPTGRTLVEEEARRAERVFVLEPSAPGGLVKTARKGTAEWTLAAHGRAAHAGLDPEKGASAILELARQIERIHAFGEPSKGTTVNVGVVRGGTSPNVIAAEATAVIDVRFSREEEARRIEAAMRGLEPIDSRVRLEVHGGVNRPPLERREGVVNLYNQARRIAALLDFELGEAQVGGASDGNFAAAVGAAVLDGLGIEGDGAHAAHEHIVISNIPRRGALLAGLIAA